MRRKNSLIILLLCILCVLCYLQFILLRSSDPLDDNTTYHDLLPPREENTSPTWWHVKGGVSCSRLFTEPPPAYANQVLLRTAYLDRIATQETRHPLRKDLYRQVHESCESYLKRRHFIRQCQSEPECKFGLAYSVVVYKDYVQVERLLRAIHRPEHTICLHVDPRSHPSFQQALANLAECFPPEEMFLHPNSVSIEWGTFSVLQAELLCMEALWKLWPKRRWKYFINLTGQEFPLRTNLELVHILDTLQGANLMQATVKDGQDPLVDVEGFVPFKLQWVKGSVHVVASAAFVNFSLHDAKAKSILNVLSGEWRFTYPEETFFPTLNHNPQLGTPGAYLGRPETDSNRYPFLARLKNWNVEPFRYPCWSGRVVRQICIWGAADLAFIGRRPELFVNKFHWNFHNVAYLCMEEWLWNRTMLETTLDGRTTSAFNLDFYRNLDVVKRHQ